MCTLQCTHMAQDCSKHGQIVSPCRFCSQQVTRTDQHCKTCPVLWQVAVVALLHHDRGPPSTKRCRSSGTCSARETERELARARTRPHGKGQRHIQDPSVENELITQMGRLLLRQSDYLSRLQSDHALVLTLRNDGARVCVAGPLGGCQRVEAQVRPEGALTHPLAEAHFDSLPPSTATRATSWGRGGFEDRKGRW